MLGDFWDLTAWFVSSFFIVLISMWEVFIYLAVVIAWCVTWLLLYAILLAIKRRPWR